MIFSKAFQLRNETKDCVVYAGVLEFTSDIPDVGYLPQWMFNQLLVEEGDLCHVYWACACSFTLS